VSLRRPVRAKAGAAVLVRVRLASYKHRGAPLNLDVTFRVGRLPAPPPQGRSGAAGAGMGAVA
jgi:hypothetical protein